MQFIALFFESQFNGFKMAFYILRAGRHTETGKF